MSRQIVAIGYGSQLVVFVSGTGTTKAAVIVSFAIWVFHFFLSTALDHISSPGVV